MKFNKRVFENAMEIFGVTVEDLDPTPEKFADKIDKDNRIGTFINFNSLETNVAELSEVAKFNQDVVEHVNALFENQLSKNERRAIIDAINVIALYSEMCCYSNIQKTYGIKVKLDKNNEDRYIGIRSIPLSNKTYRMSIEYDNTSYIINANKKIILKPEYQIALDIFKGLPVFDTTNITNTIFDSMIHTFHILDKARHGILCTRDILQFDSTSIPGVSLEFIPFDTVCVGINADGKRSVVPYLIGILVNTGKKNDLYRFDYKGYAIKVSNGDKLNKPSFMEPCKGISLEKNTELLMELIDEDSAKSSNDPMSIVLKSLRIMATAMLSFNNAHKLDIEALVNGFENYKFNDDDLYDIHKNSIKVG